MRKNIRKERFSKRFVEVSKKVEKETLYDVNSAIGLVKGTATVKFKESVDLAVRLGVDPKKGDQNVRGLVNLPHGTGKKKTVAVLAKGDQAADAEKAGADVVGAEDLIAKIQAGFKDFDVILATPEMAPQIGKVGRVLGAKTPNKRNGTVTEAVGQAVKEIKSAVRVEYRTDKGGVVHMPLGKVDFSDQQILENFNTALDAIIKAKPSGAKGKYLLSVTLSSTMGPGISLDPAVIQKSLG